MKKYCLVNTLKPEHIYDYVKLHKEAHITEWKTQLHALKRAGAVNCQTYVYDNLVIIFYECEDIIDSFKTLAMNEDNNRWQAKVAPWFARSPKFDGSEEVTTAEKIFDLNEQLEGKLTQY